MVFVADAWQFRDLKLPQIFAITPDPAGSPQTFSVIPVGEGWVKAPEKPVVSWRYLRSLEGLRSIIADDGILLSQIEERGLMVDNG